MKFLVRVLRGRAAIFAVVLVLWLRGILLAQAGAPTQSSSASDLKLDTGQEIFEAACIGCHGPGGQGQPQTTLGFEPPSTFPDFSDCNGSTREKIFDWKATIHEGGPGRGFSEIMPSFADALTLDQIDKVMQYLREQCPEPVWPLGELNFPRPLVTEKAFPEDEWVLIHAVNAAGADSGVSSEIIYEKRFGARNQLEFAAPFSASQREAGGWRGGIGDLIFGYKRTVFSISESGSILSVQGEVAMPTGDQRRGFGSGVTTFETFASFGQLLPNLGFIQMQAGAELPTDTERVPKAVYLRAAVGKTFAENRGFGRSWTPITEILADRDVETGAKTSWDIVPQLQLSLSKRQHVRLNIGVRRPLSNTTGRPTQIIFYTLWDFFDGGLREGW